MSKSMLIGWMCVGLACGYAAAEPAPMTASQQQRVDSVTHRIQNLFHLPRADARGGRLLAMTEWLDKVNPASVDAQRLLRDIHQTRRKFALAAQSAAKLHTLQPADYFNNRQWLEYTVLSKTSVVERIDVAKAIAEDPKQSAPLRAEAWMKAAASWQRRGDPKQVSVATEQCLTLDPLNQSGLLRRLSAAKDSNSVLRAQTMCGLISGNPRRWWVIRELSQLLSHEGLHTEALSMAKAAWAVQGNGEPITRAPVSVVEAYINLMLDADLAAQVATEFESSLTRYGTHPMVVSMMIEAYRETDQMTKANALKQSLEAMLRGRLATSQQSYNRQKTPAAHLRLIEAASHLTWYYLLVARTPVRGLSSLRGLPKEVQKTEAVQHLLHAASLANGQADAIVELRKLAPTRPMAAAMLAKQAYQEGEPDEGKKWLDVGLKQGRSGLAYQYLRSLAKANKVPVGPMKESAQLRACVAKIPAAVLAMGTDPASAIQVTLTTPKPDVAVGEAMVVQATLTNRSSVPMPLGAGAMVSNQYTLQLRMETPRNRPVAVEPVILFNAPKYLQPGKSVTGQVRIDIGPLDTYLRHHPLDTVRLKVTGIISPVQKRASLVSEMPTVPTPTLTLKRVGLTEMIAGVNRLQQAVEQLDRELAGGNLAVRCRASRQLGALVTYVQKQRALGNRGHAASLELSKTQLVGLVRRALADKDQAVRCDILAALCGATLSAEQLNVVAPLLRDPSPIVRMGVAELIGLSGTEGAHQVMTMLAKDKSAPVAMMANAFIRQWKKASR